MLARHPVVLVSVLLAALACGGKKDKPKDPPVVTSPGGAAAPAALTPVPAASGTIDPLVERVLAALPAGADAVIGVSIERVLGNKTVRDQADKLLTADRLPFDVKAQCGLDPLTLVKRVVVAAEEAGRARGAMFGVTRQAVLDCLPKAKPAIEAQGGTLTVDGVYAWGTASGGSFGMAFIDDTTALFAVGPEVINRPALEAMAASTPGAGLTGSAEFMAMLKKLNTDASVWMVANGTKAAAQLGPIASMLPPLKAVLIAAEASSAGVAADVRFRTTSADGATSLVTGMGGQAKSMVGAGFATRADFVAEGEDAHLVLLITDAQLQRIYGMLKGFLGGALGGLARKPAAPAPAPAPAPPATP